MSRPLFRLVLVAALSGCSYQGVVVKKEARLLPFSESVGQDALYKFELRDDHQLIHSQLVSADVFDRYQIGDFFSDTDRSGPPPKKNGRVQKAVRKHLGKVLPPDRAELDRPLRSNPEIGASSQLALLLWPLLRPDYRSLYLTPAAPTPAFALAADPSPTPAASLVPPEKKAPAAAKSSPTPTPSDSASAARKEQRTPFWKRIFRKKASPTPAPTVSATPAGKKPRRRHSRRRSRRASAAAVKTTATPTPAPSPAPSPAASAAPNAAASVKNKFRLTTEAERNEALQKAAAEKTKQSKGRRRLGEIPEERPEREGF